MVDNLIQCCYTNDGGWKTVAVAGNPPSSAYEYCSQFQAVNSEIPSEGWKAEDGGDLNLFEIHSDEHHVYICRTQFGLTDRAGRNNMFSHAFILPWSSALRDPNTFLTIANSNFAANQEDAERQTHGDYLPRFTLKSALADLEMSRESYSTLIRCIYAQIVEEKVPVPLYIEYDGSDLQMRELLFCIYTGIPNFLRKRLQIASAATRAPERMHIIFSTKAEKEQKFFIPRTGQENFLKEKTIKKIERNGYLDHAARHLDEELSHPGFFQNYFDELEREAASLGDASGANDLILKIAYQIKYRGNESTSGDNELEVLLTDALRSKSYGNAKMDGYIAGLLRSICSRGMTLTESAEELLENRINGKCTDELIDSADVYYVGQLERLNVPDAAEKLRKLPEVLFGRYAQKLRKTSRGLEILDQYYNKVIFAEQPVDWDLLEKVRRESTDLRMESRVSDKLEENAWRLYTSALESGHAVDGLNDYQAFMRRILPADAIQACIATAKEEYWNGVTFANFDPEKGEEYNEMNTSCNRTEMFYQFVKLLRCKVEDNGDIHDYLSQLDEFFGGEVHGVDISDEEIEVAVRRIAAVVEENSTGLKDREPFFAEWTRVVALVGHSPLRGRIVRKLHENIYDIRKHEADTFYDKCDELCSTLKEFNRNYRTATTDHPSARLESIHKALLLLVRDECMACDDEEYAVSLDVWLMIGAFLYTSKNCYHIFDDVKPAALEEDSADVLEYSALFPATLAAAEKYVEERGSEAKVVKRWLNAKIKQDKAAQKGDKSIFGGLLSNLGRRDTGNDDEPSPSGHRRETETSRDAPDKRKDKDARDGEMRGRSDHSDRKDARETDRRGPKHAEAPGKGGKREEVPQKKKGLKSLFGGK